MVFDLPGKVEIPFGGLPSYFLSKVGQRRRILAASETGQREGGVDFSDVRVRKEHANVSTRGGGSLALLEPWYA